MIERIRRGWRGLTPKQRRWMAIGWLAWIAIVAIPIAERHYPIAVLGLLLWCMVPYELWKRGRESAGYDS